MTPSDTTFNSHREEAIQMLAQASHNAQFGRNASPALVITVNALLNICLMQQAAINALELRVINMEQP